MKNITYLLVFSLISFPAVVSAQDEFKYEPVANKAEYYVDKLKPGKDFEDLLKWGLQRDINQFKVATSWSILFRSKL